MKKFFLVFAHQMTKGTATGNTPTIYSAKLLELVDTILAAHNFVTSDGRAINPLSVDSYYPSRFVCPTVAIIYDFCYDELGITRRTALQNRINQYFDGLRANGYQANGRAGDNYFIGHLLGVGLMGYATWGDNSRAPEMIAWAQNRFDGTPSALIGADTAKTNITQVFQGGYPTTLSTETYNNRYTKLTQTCTLGNFAVCFLLHSIRLPI